MRYDSRYDDLRGLWSVIRPVRTPPLLLRRVPTSCMATPAHHRGRARETRTAHDRLRVPGLRSPLPRNPTLQRLQHLLHQPRPGRTMSPLRRTSRAQRPPPRMRHRQPAYTQTQQDHNPVDLGNKPPPAFPVRSILPSEARAPIGTRAPTSSTRPASSERSAPTKGAQECAEAPDSSQLPALLRS